MAFPTRAFLLVGGGGLFLVVYSMFLLTVGPLVLKSVARDTQERHLSKQQQLQMADSEISAIRGKLEENERLVSNLVQRLDRVSEDYTKAISAVGAHEKQIEEAVSKVRTQIADEEQKNAREHSQLTTLLDRARHATAAPVQANTASTQFMPPAVTTAPAVNVAQASGTTTRPASAITPRPIPPTRPPVTAAPLTAECREQLKRVDPTAPLITTKLESVDKRPLTTMDLRLGRADMILKLTPSSSCVAWNFTGEVHDPYIEAHQLLHSRKAGCNAKLQEALITAFGNVTQPFSDRFQTGLGGMVINFRPRKRFPTGVDFKGVLRLPQVCFTHGHQLTKEDGDLPGMDAASKVEIVIPAPEKPIAALSGDVLEQLHDGILLDGGRAGKIVLSHEIRWAFGHPEFAAKVQDMLKSVFGPADDGHPDAVVPGWDASTVDFVLGPRHTARNHHGKCTKTFPDVPAVLMEHVDHDVSIPEPITIADVITPYIELDFTTAYPKRRRGLNAVSKDVFMAEGFAFDLSLHAGVFFINDHATVAKEVALELTKVFGAPTTPDAVTVLSSTQAHVVLGSRAGTNPHWVAHGSPFANRSHAPPSSHRVLRFTVPNTVLVTPPLNAPSECLLPDVPSCDYIPYEEFPLAPIPAITVQLQDRLVFKWAVVGAGPSGMNGLGRVMDLWAGREDQVLWIDERGFKVGRLEGYHDVQSMNPCADFVNYMKDYKVYTNPEIGSSQSPLLNFEGSARNCRLGYLSEPLLKATRQFRSKLVSYHGRVTDMHKVWFPNATKTNASTDFVWSMEVADDEQPVWITDGVLLALGADIKNNSFPVAKLPTEIPFTTGLNPGKLRTFITQDVTAKGLKESGKRVAVFGAGPSGVVALHNLALMPAVDSVVHFTHGARGDYTAMRTVKHNGEYLNITRVKYDAKTIEADLNGTDYMIQCTGWVWPGFPYNGTIQSRQDSFVSPKLFNVGVKSGSKGSYHTSRSQLFFISSLRTYSRKSSMGCDVHNVTCMAREYPTIPFTLADPYVKPEKPTWAW